MLIGERMPATEAHRIGLVTRVFPVDRLFDEVQRIAETIASRAPLAVAFAKEAVRKGAELPYHDGRRLEVDLLTHLLNTDDRAEAGAAFREKRKPVFRGR
jgi:enoyl-CoA hydratase/carnithine racemase